MEPRWILSPQELTFTATIIGSLLSPSPCLPGYNQGLPAHPYFFSEKWRHVVYCRQEEDASGLATWLEWPDASFLI